jgi:hypothetical protein
MSFQTVMNATTFEIKGRSRAAVDLRDIAPPRQAQYSSVRDPLGRRMNV